MNYKFKINGLWCLDPFRKLSEDGEFKNHIFDPLSHHITHHEQSETTCDIIETFSVEITEKKIKDILVIDLWGHSMNIIDG